MLVKSTTGGKMVGGVSLKATPVLFKVLQNKKINFF
jgi:hypothetical protein